jgi:hypothetical protein
MTLRVSCRQRRLRAFSAERATQGNLYVAEVAGGRAQKFRPRAGASKTALIAARIYAAWK